MVEAPAAFSFGANWSNYLERALDPGRLETARAQTAGFLRLDSLAGMTFLDIGCGSGIFSHAAWSMGASRIVSLDVDPVSVECCRRMRMRAGDPQHWEVRQGSILDPDTVRALPRSDIVYSWGVLHHTGDMWTAIRNAARRVRFGGRFYISIYNRVEYDTLMRYRGSHGWARLKRRYNRSGRLGRRIMELGAASRDVAACLVRGRNPVRELRRYSRKRGMSWWYDIVDGLGGWPYEFASAGEVFNFCHDELGLQLERLRTTCSIGCNEFLFVLPRPAREAIALLEEETACPTGSYCDDETESLPRT